MLRLLYVFMFLLAGNVQADDGRNAIPPRLNTVDSDNAVAVAITSSKPERTVPPSLIEAERLHKRQRQLTPSRIELLRATVTDTTVEKGFFSSLFSSNVSPLDTELLAEMDSFIDRFSELEETAEIYHLKAKVYKRINGYPAAALSWLMLLAAYPDSPFAAEAQKGLKELSGDKLKKHASIIKVMSESTGSLSGDHDHRVAAFLIFLGTLREADFAAPIAAECAAFQVRNRTYPDEDRIEHALAHQQMMYGSDVAIYHFNKLLALYSASSLRSDSMLSIGLIQREGLKHYAQSVESFKSVIENDPDSDEARQAYESLASMYDNDMRDYTNAIKTYDAIAARYKNDAVVLRGLQALARIYQDKTNQPVQAIATYRKLDDTFRGHDGMDALSKAEKLAFYTLKDWNLSIEINDRIISYPDYDEAVVALYANAVICEDNLKEYGRAIKLYQELINRFPRHELSTDAKRRSSALEQKR